MTHGQRDTRQGTSVSKDTIGRRYTNVAFTYLYHTFLALAHHCPSTDIKLYHLVTEAGVREQLVQAVLDNAVGEPRTRDLSITSPKVYH